MINGIDNVSLDGGVYYRSSKGNVADKYDIEFIKKIKEITGDNFHTNKDKFNTTYITYNNELCICGHECMETYILEHIPSNKKIALGSYCIDKVYDGYSNKLNLFKKNGVCKICKSILIKGGCNKNYNDKCSSRCYACISNKEKELQFKEDFLNKCIRELNDEKYKFEIEKIQYNTMFKRVYLNVNFKDKDKAKEMGACWDRDKKLWYTPNKMNKELIEMFG